MSLVSLPTTLPAGPTGDERPLSAGTDTQEVAVSDLRSLLTIQEVADLLAVPAKTVRDWRLRGIGPPGIKLGRHVRFRPLDVETWLEAQRESVR